MLSLRKCPSYMFNVIMTKITGRTKIFVSKTKQKKLLIQDNNKIVDVKDEKHTWHNCLTVCLKYIWKIMTFTIKERTHLQHIFLYCLFSKIKFHQGLKCISWSTHSLVKISSKSLSLYPSFSVHISSAKDIIERPL